MIYGAFQVWNPEYEPAGVLRHAEVLERAYKQSTAGGHVWWGKISRTHKRGEVEVDHAKNPDRKLQFLILTNCKETHFCTVLDLRWPYQDDGLPNTPDRNVPDYYSKQHLTVKYWFKVDSLCAIAADLRVTLDQLRQFKDSQGRPLNLYEQRRYDYPCLVQIDDASYERFAGLCRGHAPHFCEAALGPETNQSLATVRERLGPVFSSLDSDVQVFLATAEQAYRTLKLDSSPAILSMFKAYEVIMKSSLIPAIGRNLGRRANRIPLSLRNHPAITLDRYTVADSRWLDTADIMTSVLTDYVKLHLVLEDEDKDWLFSKFGGFVAAAAKVRNTASHKARMSRGDARDLYNATLKTPDTSNILRLHRLCGLISCR